MMELQEFMEEFGRIVKDRDLDSLTLEVTVIFYRSGKSLVAQVITTKEEPEVKTIDPKFSQGSGIHY